MGDQGHQGPGGTRQAAQTPHDPVSPAGKSELAGFEQRDTEGVQPGKWELDKQRTGRRQQADREKCGQLLNLGEGWYSFTVLSQFL